MAFHFVYGATNFVPKLKIAPTVSVLFCPSMEEAFAAEEAVEGMVVCLSK